ncbi:EamA family transporter [Salinisphaera sp. Q1T1-3]|uniref:EamA family transporter n=1 Tax=Salinisphaera sp. Q1T1-3 TaxID=2321229 RepID=UPI000E72FDBF|nr:EamA family transporter [Salinisphaera sp. Q1T1-3]RJS91622.1 EamA family transporter [Salinisphaera sp. Q1T1-3]
MSRSRHPLLARLWPVGLLLIAMSAIQSGASLAHSAFPIAGAAGITSLRLILAAVLLIAIFRPWRRRIAPGAWPAILVYGVALGVMNFLFYQALARIPLGIAVAFEFTGPLSVALIASRRVLDLLWVLIAVAGLAVLLWPEPGLGHALDPLGIVCALGAGACWALYILFGQKAGQINGMQSAVLGVSIAAILVAPVGAWHAGSILLDPTVLALGAGVAVLSTALPYTLEMIAMPRLPTATFGTLMSLEPAFGALSGLIFLGQSLGTAQWLAIGAVMAASMGTTLTPGGVDEDEAHEAPRPD